MTKLIVKLLCAAAPIAVAIPLFAAGAVPNGKPEDAGFSGERLGRILMQTSTPQLQRDFENAVMQAMID